MRICDLHAKTFWLNCGDINSSTEDQARGVADLAHEYGAQKAVGDPCAPLEIRSRRMLLSSPSTSLHAACSMTDATWVDLHNGFSVSATREPIGPYFKVCG